MADIHVQTKKTNHAPSWLWIMIVLIVLALIIYFIVSNKPNEIEGAKEKLTSFYSLAGVEGFLRA
jgi:hypothetical protein